VIPSTYLELHNTCYEAYNANPLASAVIEITTSFVLGKGVMVAAREPAVQDVLMDFWHDLDNHMDTRVYALCTELSLYGEQFIRFFVRAYDGRVKIRQIDPSLIDQIETDPEDIETALRFHRRPIGPSATLPGDPAPVTAADQHNFEGEWLLAGRDVAQFAINKVSNAKRGKSDLATLLPWLRRYKDWLTDRVRINKYKGAFLWDVQLAGIDHIAQEKVPIWYSSMNRCKCSHAVSRFYLLSSSLLRDRLVDLECGSCPMHGLLQPQRNMCWLHRLLHHC
jgi:hypothetical protein